MELTNGSLTETSSDPFCLESPVSCFSLSIIGYVCILLVVLGFISNSTLLFACLRFKELKNPLYTCIMTLAILNLVGVVIELPFIVISNLSCKWIFGKFGCYFSSIVMFFIGCSSIYIMCIISLQRFYIVYWPLKIREITSLSNGISIGIAMLVSIFWALMPMLGWSYYSLEGALTSCSIEWKERSFNVISYNMSILVIVFIIPVAIIVSTNVMLLIKVLSMPSMTTGDYRAKQQQKDERRLTINVVIFMTGFVVSWSPYAVTCLYTAFWDNAEVDPLIGTSLAIFAKSSMVWAPMLFIFSNRIILRNLFKMRKSNDGSEIDTSLSVKGH